MSDKIFAIDFFSGAGGLTRGLLNAGIEVRLGIEIDESCKLTYETNNEPAKMLSKDVRKVSIEDVKRYVGNIDSNELLLAACAPCQPFTQQRRKQRKYKERNLILEFGRFVEKLKPKYVLIENVPGIRNVKGHSSFKRFLKLLEKNGYQWHDDVVNAKSYGVPQSRNRLVLLAGNGFKPEIPKPTHGEQDGLQPFVTVKDAISHYPAIEAGEESKAFDNHWSASITPLNLKRIKASPEDGGDRRVWDSELVLKCHKKINRKTGKQYKGHTDVYGRMWWDKPAPTLTCKCISISNGRYGHPAQDRGISLREAARLQSFPDDYKFIGSSKVHLARQVGNAVPVRLGEVFGKYFLSLHEDQSKSRLVSLPGFMSPVFPS